MTKLIEPKILKGTRDFFPKQMAKRNFVLQKLIQVFKLFGYDQIDTPSIEYAETLFGKYGEEGSKLTYSFKDLGGRKIALRYDQTVPTARVVATNYNDLPMPFKRYQISNVWRADKPAKGRYREFTQCDIDIIGTTNLLSEAEVAKIIYKAFKNLGFNNFIIKVNSRRLINNILDNFGVSPEKQLSVIRSLDKLEKVGPKGVRKELSNVLDKSNVDKLFSVVMIKGDNKEKLKKLKKYDIREMETFLDLCKNLSIPDKFIEFDISLARGLDYYTGIVYEIFIPGQDFGAFGGGGRYDDLCSLFIDKKFSGVGVTFGLDRIILAMEEKSMLDNMRLNSKVLVINFSEDTLDNNLKMFNELQKANINTEIYFEPTKLDKQFKYANKKQIPFVVICGSDEIEKGIVSIKDMKTGKQINVLKDQIIDYFSSNLNIVK
ncbi:MAG: histidine--tRNA ligase [Candidatus Magasanikbacteria bacterium]|jgi:histidyl-tRNA synthetase|nr:histidine--tRNA ligase [Candidatus Magasanikbacteria bacterium]